MDQNLRFAPPVVFLSHTHFKGPGLMFGPNHPKVGSVPFTIFGWLPMDLNRVWVQEP